MKSLTCIWITLVLPPCNSSSVSLERFFWSPHVSNQKPSCLQSPHRLALLPHPPQFLALPTLYCSFWVILNFFQFFKHTMYSLLDLLICDFFFSCLEYFLFSLPLANSCFFFGSNIKNTSFWMLSWMFQAKVPLSGLSVPSEQEPSSITITWVFASPLDCHFCEDWSMSSFKCYLQCLAVIDVQQVLSIYLLNEWMSLNINHEPAFFMTQVQICNFFLASPVSLTGTTIPFPQSKQNFIDDKATYISQRKKNFPKGLRISIW